MTSQKKNDLYKALEHAHSQTKYEGQLIWNVFNSMVAVNTLLTAFSVAFLSLFSNSNKLIYVLLISGVILCAGWYLMMQRMFSFYKYWYSWIRFYERELFEGQYQMINVGKTFSEGDTVLVDEDRLRINGISRIVKNESIVRVCIFLISLMYLLMLYFTIIMNG
ncbi:MAG: hypothetical protein AAF634_12365 [Bacteroidota bacterium]